MLNTKLLHALIFAFVTVTVYAGNAQFDKAHAGKTKFVIVLDAQWGSGPKGVSKRNGALLITDAKTIQEHERLFIDNRSENHACSYHYQIQFWAGADDRVGDFPFNQNCEEFYRNSKEIHALMGVYIQQIESKPTHYIYNLKIPATMAPEDVKKSIINSNLNILFFAGRHTNYSYLTFSYEHISLIKESLDKIKWKGEQEENKKLAIEKISTLINDILLQVSSTVQPPANDWHWSESFGGGTIKHKATVSLKFATADDLSKAKSIILSRGGIIRREQIADHYFIQLVDISNKLDIVKAKLSPYKFVLDTYEYPNTK